jgi:hypothetical protein
MSMSIRSSRRLVAAGQGVAGVALAARPETLVAAVCRSGERPPSWIVRLLGVRMSAQAVATAVRPHRAVELAGAAGDLAHAASMVWVARRMPRYQRPALASGVLAALFAGAALATVRAERVRR